MTRMNLLELIDINKDINRDRIRIHKLTTEEKVLGIYSTKYTFLDFFERECFQTWTLKGHYIDFKDFMQDININSLYAQSLENSEALLSYYELVLNIWHSIEKKTLANFVRSQAEEWHDVDDYRIHENFFLIKTIIEDSLSEFNYMVFYDAINDVHLVIEDKPEVTATAEIVEQKTACSIIRYNHHRLKGDLISKKNILLYLGKQLEPKRDDLNQINSKLSNDIFYLLNNCGLRHNNLDVVSKNYKQGLADLAEDSQALENLYDELYQMILLANLELDNIDRHAEVTELKNKIELK